MRSSAARACACVGTSCSTSRYAATRGGGSRERGLLEIALAEQVLGGLARRPRRPRPGGAARPRGRASGSARASTRSRAASAGRGSGPCDARSNARAARVEVGEPVLGDLAEPHRVGLLDVGRQRLGGLGEALVEERRELAPQVLRTRRAAAAARAARRRRASSASARPHTTNACAGWFAIVSRTSASASQSARRRAGSRPSTASRRS